MHLIYTENNSIKYQQQSYEQVLKLQNGNAYFLDMLTEVLGFLVKYFVVVFSDTNLTVQVIVTTDLLEVDK